MQLFILPWYLFEFERNTSGDFDFDCPYRVKVDCSRMYN